MKMTRFLSRQPIQLCLFFIALALFVWPFLAAPAVADPSSMFCYLFSAWGLILGVVFFVSRACGERRTAEKTAIEEID